MSSRSYESPEGQQCDALARMSLAGSVFQISVWNSVTVENSQVNVSNVRFSCSIVPPTSLGLPIQRLACGLCKVEVRGVRGVRGGLALEVRGGGLVLEVQKGGVGVGVACRGATCGR